jgi:acyl-homoserine lactone acylase PvdQ
MLAAACRRHEIATPPLVAQVSGTMTVAGLSAPVRVARDRWGVPHIYADNQDDLFMAQGLVQAQDRLFQMDLWRRSVQGRLSEVLGPNFIERDAMTRRMQYRGDPDLEWTAYAPDAKAIAGAFVRGINAWVALAHERLPEEFALAGWKPEFWSPADLLNRTDAFVASSGAAEEVFRARLIAALGASRAARLFAARRLVENAADLDPTTVSYIVGEAIRRVGTRPFFSGLAAPIGRSGDLRSPAGGRQSQQPARTFDNPSPRYLVHLTAPGWNVIGATAPWLPGIAVGHNERIAWTLDDVDADTQDIYVERVNPANPHQVADGPRWIGTEIVKDAVIVKGRQKPFIFDHEFTRHGVVVASDRERNLVFTVRWSGTEPGTAAELGALALDRAVSWQEFRNALARWRMPARTVTFADVEHNRGYQVAAWIPVRTGWSGAMPAPGWTGRHEWTGWRTLDELPHAFHARGGATRPGPPAGNAARQVSELARRHPNSVDVLLQKLEAAASANDALRAQEALVAETLASATTEQLPAAVTFTHPLAVTEAARRLFNIGPVTSPRHGQSPFGIISTAENWDRSQAMNAPGQSGSPSSPHYGDLATLWQGGNYFSLAFSREAVQAHTESTLTLLPQSVRPPVP